MTNIKHYALIAILTCWAIGTTVLSHDRILYHVATGISNQANVVAIKYTPPIEIKETVIYKELNYADNMPPKLPINQVYNKAIEEFKND